MALLYMLLLMGAAATVYPFLVMVSTATKGATDQNDNALVPAYWLDDGLQAGHLPDPASLYGKYLDDKYSGQLGWIKSTRIGAGSPPERVYAYRRFLESLPPEMWLAAFRASPTQVTSRLTVRYQRWLRQRFSSIDQLNRAYIEENVSFQSTAPPSELLERPTWKPRPGRKWDDWLVFKRALPAEFRNPIRSERLFQEFVRGRFQNQFGAAPADLKRGAKDFEELRIAPSHVLWQEFVAQGLPAQFRDGTIEDRWAQVAPGEVPVEADERGWVRENAASIRWEMAIRNARYVLDYVAVQGRALWNTAIFCGLAVLIQLIVNPLAAYALSRYPMPWTGKLIVFLLATMAFPAEVAMIPAFLLLKDVNLLNTFWALVLPTAANGYMIFLLKGFFDSLPGEIFESGQMDGAKEHTMMWKLALPLSKPVLGYLGILAFMGAYGAFIFAFLVVQDQRMWTLMVWIYQLQLSAPKSVTMAALVLAAVPTLLVFLLFQRVIMRGIVLPSER